MTETGCDVSTHRIVRSGTFKIGDAICYCGMVTVAAPAYITDGTVTFKASANVKRLLDTASIPWPYPAPQEGE